MGNRLAKTLFGLAIALGLAVSFNHCAPPGSQSLNNLGSTDDPANPNNPGTPQSQNYFASKVLPVFEGQCISCHNEPRFGGQGPLTIYNYLPMRVKLATGGSAFNNDLINKVTGQVPHTGGNQCFNGLNASPCSDLVAWWQFEMGGSGSGIIGRLETVSALGQVIGWTLDTRTPATILNAIVYAGGPVGTGTLVGSYPANQTGLGGQGAGHYFIFTLPNNLRDGVLRDLYIYGNQATAANLLQGSPKRFASYLPKAAGQTYFQNTVGPALQQACSRCHGTLTYNDQFLNLVTPTPAEGGTATTNRLVQKPSAQITHGGGNVCGGINGSPCNLIQEWWRREFQ